jgi:hypothetical protein
MNEPFRLLVVLLPAVALPWQPAPLEWKELTPKDGSFSVFLPGTPTEHKKTVMSPSGMVEVVLFEVAVPPADGKFVAGYSEFPEASIKPGTEDKRLDNARDGAIASAKGKLVRQKNLLLDKYPGREVVIKIEGKATVLLRLFAVKNRLYQLVVVGNEELLASKEAEKFLKSFKLGR